MSDITDLKKVTIIGDLFMRADVFADALRQLDGVRFDIRTFETDWPDNPFGPAFDGIREYQGSAEASAQQIDDADICITHLAPISRSVFERCPNLRYIGVSRGGPVNIDLKAARDFGVTVANAPGRNASAVAEFTVGAILSQTRLITQAHVDLRRGVWRGDLYRADRTGRELSQMTVGLIGYSAVGRRVARLLAPFGCRIIYCDPFVELSDDDRELGVHKCDLDDLLSDADIVSLHARLTPQTRRMIDGKTLSAMKRGAYLINTARGELLDQAALIEALESGQLAGAALDTYDPEPPFPDDPLLKLTNITLSPHIAGASALVAEHTAQRIAADVGNFLAGRELNNPC
ncbi:2-hydroxyacid dehydrogenase [Hoeflea prorocentri]|uniref:2-hydroxyacid dehydrogenase n=1 Tax=Hoeflea prorocentri TaxID=1922333 RepID=A0A9X3UIP8_9HYPH|nr:2-hydroxyacid dehydrogenase [Hoeflea prorocentri]MCY6381563.1 2-hydroxyacid dehydrogenase [Hoeflea prorocentri]MDA5399363.1 2-hydroxyacid dehydrogenase [Hoeflea prorocentri]